jgi:hypothetical protein
MTMSDKKQDDGGPAFPVRTGLSKHPVMGHVFDGTDGMSLRDYFAGQALPSLTENDRDPQVVAEEAYDYADAMIAERERRR